MSVNKFFNRLLHVDFKEGFFTESFQLMSAALTFQIGLNDCARVIRGKFTFAADLESFQINWHHVT